jgi:hypothetical protein
MTNKQLIDALMRKVSDAAALTTARALPGGAYSWHQVNVRVAGIAGEVVELKQQILKRMKDDT